MTFFQYFFLFWYNNAMKDKKVEKVKKIKIYVVLDNIRSALNVGSIFRTSDAFLVEKIYLCGITPTPDNKKVLKTALGAEKSVKWEYKKDILELIETLRKRDKNIRIISLEQTRESRDLKDVKIKNDICLIIGNEVSGVSREVLKLSDNHINIPMKGKKESLNVSNAFSIAIYELSAN